MNYNNDPQKLYDMDTIYINILFVRKLWLLKGLKTFVQVHKAHRQSCNLIPGLFEF